MNGKLLTYFEKAAISNKISHAFLACNTSFDKIKLDLENVLNNYFFNENVDLTNSLDVLIVNPQKDKITKEQIIDIQMELANKSQINDNRVYIITEANKMNDYAANSLLKFLEEPQENVYAFLITNNIDKVLPTIKSRCQIIYVDNVEENCLDLYSTDDIMCTLNLIDLIEKKKYFCFPFIYDIISKREEKEKLVKIMTIMEYFYYDVFIYISLGKVNCFNNCISKVEEIAFLNNNKEVVRKLMVINKALSMLQYNLNINLFIDKLIIDLVGELNE